VANKEKKEKKEKKAGDLKAFYMVLGVTAVIAVGALGWSTLRGGLSAEALNPISSIVLGEIDDLQALVNMATGVERGDPNAPITILEFGDFQCPSCQQFATFVKPQVDLAYVDTGIAKFVFHDWPFHDQLFAHQSTWGPQISAMRDREVQGYFEEYATAIGLNEGDFTTCLESDRHAEVVSSNIRLGMELGVNGTPTIFVSKGGGSGIRVNRWNEFEGFQDVIERLMEEDGGV
jgi:protein-disulfide isomerase